MTDRIEALERLQRLRESGALSDEEFRQEKAALLGGGDAPLPGPPTAAIAEGGAADAAAQIYAPPGRRGPPLWMMAAGAILLIAVVVGAMFLLRGGGGRETFDAGSIPPANVVADPPANATASAPEPVGIRTRPEAEQLAAAFRAAFGGQPVRDADDGEITYRAARLLWVGERAVLISNGSNAEECHVCAGAVAVHHLLPEGDGFKVDGAWLRVATDDYGRPPEWRISTELTGRPALRVDNGGGNQGIFCNFSTWYDLSGGRPSELARVQTGYTNEGEEGGFDLAGRIANLRPGRSFDVVYSGYESFTESYRWRGGRFEKEGGETRVPQC
ncbi:MAG TPA: SHOCT domain-containing protein [Allosphingosinicella sp.]|jgi:hypothetical protein